MALHCSWLCPLSESWLCWLRHLPSSTSRAGLAAARLPLPGSSRGGRGPRGLFSLCVASVSRSAPAGRLLLSDCLHTGVSVGLSVGVLPGDNGPAHTAWGHGDMSSVCTSDAGSPSRASLGLLCGLALRCDGAPGCHLGSEHLSGLTAWEAGEEDTFILDPARPGPFIFPLNVP